MHVVSERELLHPTLRWELPDEAKMVKTAGGSLVVEFIGLMMVRLKNKKGKWFLVEAPALFVPGMTADTLLSETQLVSCSGCEETKCFGLQGVRQRVMTEDAEGKRQTIEIEEEQGVFLVHMQGVSCEEMRRRRTIENVHEVKVPKVIRTSEVYSVSVARVSSGGENVSDKVGEYLNIHHKCGHVSERKIKETVRLGAIEGIKVDLGFGNKHVCTSCSQGDPRRNNQPRKSFRKSKRPFDEVHIDFCYMPREDAEQEMPLDTFLPQYIGKALVAVDEFTRWKFVRPLDDLRADSLADAIISIDNAARGMVKYLLKTEGCAKHMEQFSSPFTWDEIRDEKKPLIKSIKSDQGSQIRAMFGTSTGETLFVKASNFEIGIQWTYSEAYKPRQNGLVERSIGVLGANAMVVRQAAGFGTRGAYYAHEYCAFTENLFLHESLGTTPFFRMFGTPYNAKVRKLHPFGALAFPLIENRSKHTIPRTVGLFLGYEDFPGRGYVVSQPCKKEWEFYHLGLAPVFEAKRVSSDTTTTSYAWVKQQQKVMHQHLVDAFPRRSTVINLREEYENPREVGNNTDVEVVEITRRSGDEEEDDEYFDAAGEMHEDSIYYSALGIDDDRDEEEVTSKYVAMGMTTYLAPHRGIKAMAIRIGNGGKVRKLEEVPEEEKLESQMEEFRGFETNGIGEQMFLPADRKVTDLKLVQTMRKDDTVKSRFAVRGFRQMYGVNYFNTYAPVATAQSIRLAISLAAIFGVELWAADVAKAFLQAPLQEDVYIKIPEWLPYDKSKGNVLKLLKSVYGCKQSSRNWWNKMSTAIIECGATQDKKDPCVFHKFDGDGDVELFVCIVVDDILAVGRKEVWDDFIKLLGTKVELEKESVGIAKEFFGIKINRKDKHLIEINQGNYAEEVLKRYQEKYHFIPKEKVNVPLREKDVKVLLDWTSEEDEEEEDELTKEKYMSLFGSLMFLSVWTRPDISMALGLAGTRLKSPSKKHLKALEHILSYVAKDTAKPIIYDARLSKNKVDLIGFSDASFGSDRRDGKSTTGYVTFLCGPVHWSSKKQSTVALSTTTAESIAAMEATKELAFETQILSQIGLGAQYAPLFIDNKQTIQRVMENSPTPASKHELIRERWISEICLKEKLVWPMYVRTDNNIADILTKGKLADGDAQFIRLAKLISGKGEHDIGGVRRWIEALMEIDGSFTKDSLYPSLEAYNKARSERLYSRAFKASKIEEVKN